MVTDNEATRRLFFALWPGDAERRQLADAARRWSRYPVPETNLHITLAFLGQCSEVQRQCYSDAVSGIPMESFDLQLDYLGAWERRGILWLGSSRIPPSLLALVKELNAALARCGFEPDKKPFVPHVTLSRKEKKPHPKSVSEVIHWPVRELFLMESVTVAGRVQYTALQRWPMQQPV